MKKNWIDKLSIDGYIKHEDFQKTTVENFFTNYSIHDSYLIDFKTNHFDEVILVFQIDPYWSEEFKQYQTDKVKKWPYVVINFLAVSDFHAELKNHGMQLGFAGAEFETHDDGIKVLLHGTYGDEFSLITKNDLLVLCINYKYNKLSLKEL